MQQNKKLARAGTLKSKSQLVTHFTNLGRFDLLPHWRFEHDGLRITCYPTSKPEELVGAADVRTLGSISFGGVIDSEGSIRDAVIAKAKRYGVLDLPLVVAVNATDPFITERDVLGSLYGSLRGGREPEMLNDSRGVWGNKTWTRLSAVLMTRKVRPDRMVNVPICLYHNPQPKRSYLGELTRLPQVIPRNNRLVTQSGEAMESILNLPSDFPE